MKHTTTALRRVYRGMSPQRATEFADASGESEELVIPEDLTALSDDDLAALHTAAVEAFDNLYGDGADLTDEDVAALASLTEGIESITAETTSREEAMGARLDQAAALAARIHPAEEDADAPADADTTGGDAEDEAPAEESAEDGDASADAPADDAPAEESLAASGTRREFRLPMTNVKRRAARAARRPAANAGAKTIQDVLIASGEGLGVAVGTGLDWMGAGRALDRRLSSYNRAQYENAARMGRAVREQQSLVTLRRDIPEDMVIRSGDPEHVSQVLARATDESRLPQGSLVASGGWCAPSTVLYDIVGEVESRDGILSIPEVGVERGGVSFTTGPDFVDIYNDATGWHITEQDDIDGKYAPGTGADAGTNVVGDKPVYKVDCPDFEEHRLDVDGIWVQAGLLQSKGFPEVLARTLRGVLVAHDHRINGSVIDQIATGSTAVTMPATQVGTTAPVLTAIELQVEHYRSIRRMARSATLEAVFPFWVHGAIRSDLARRDGVDVFDVNDARINAWFTARGINPQFVYDWQTPSGAAADFTAWGDTVKFLLYSAGTWFKGTSDIITLNTQYDSTLLAQNDFTALFTEEGWFVAERGQDSRLVTVSLSAPGAIAARVAIAQDGTETPAA